MRSCFQMQQHLFRQTWWMSLHETFYWTMENPNWNWGIILWLKKWTGWKHCKYQQQPVLQTAADTKTQISCLMDLWKRSETCLANPTLCCNSAHAPHAPHATCGGTSWKAKNRCQWPRWWKGQKLHHSQASQSLQRDEVAEGGQPAWFDAKTCAGCIWVQETLQSLCLGITLQGNVAIDAMARQHEQDEINEGKPFIHIVIPGPREEDKHHKQIWFLSVWICLVPKLSN